MCLYPDVQKKAQAEIDAFVGTDRLPTISDRESLPYVEGVMKEVLRWIPVVPLGESPHQTHPPLLSLITVSGMAHRVSENDLYENLSIPEGSMILPNIWYVASPLLRLF